MKAMQFFTVLTVAYVLLLANAYLLLDDPDNLARVHLYCGLVYFNAVGEVPYFIVKPRCEP